jgi:hypothetical protein
MCKSFDVAKFLNEQLRIYNEIGKSFGKSVEIFGTSFQSSIK